MDGSILDDAEDLSIDYKENTYILLQKGEPVVSPLEAKKYGYVKTKTVTYPMIIKYVKDKYNLKISSNNIAEVKRKHGLGTQRTNEAV